MLIAPLCDNEASTASPVDWFAVCGWFACVLYVVEVAGAVCLLARCRCFLLDPYSGSFLSRVDIFDFAGILRHERSCCLRLILLCIIRGRSGLTGCLSDFTLQSLKSLSLGSRIRSSIRPRISAAKGLLSDLSSARDFEISSALPEVSKGRVLGSASRYTARELSWQWNLAR